MAIVKRRFRFYHLYCIKCERGWHFANIGDYVLMKAVHDGHPFYGLPIAIKCGVECANDWESCKKASKGVSI